MSGKTTFDITVENMRAYILVLQMSYYGSNVYLVSAAAPQSKFIELIKNTSYITVNSVSGTNVNVGIGSSTNDAYYYLYSLS